MPAVRGKRLPPRPVVVRNIRDQDVTCWLMLGYLLRGLFRIAVYVVRLWWLTIPAAALGLAYLTLAWLGVALVVFLVAGPCIAWWQLAPDGFRRVVVHPYAARVRLWLIYRRRWTAAMLTCELATLAHIDGERHVPRIVRIRSNAWCDKLTIRMLDGQVPLDWAEAAQRLAYTFHVDTAAARTNSRVGQVVLTFRRRDPLAAVIPPLTPPAAVDLAGLPLGVTEDGDAYRLCLAGTHVLVGGATNAGKGSVIWAILAALAPAIHDRSVHVHAFDPKGGMELAFGAPLFKQFFHGTPEDMADGLEDLVAVMRTRTDRLRGVTRQHVPTTAEPLHVLIVDELAALTAYVTDRKTKERIRDAFSLLLSQGRAVGVHVIAALQDPRKEVLPFRDLFPTRIALRLTEADQVKLILSDSARDLGARCEQISLATPGVGFVMIDGTPEPVRVRFAYHDDDAIHHLARTYGRLHAVPDFADEHAA